MDILRTRWIVYLNLQEGYVYCERGGWVSMNDITKSEDRIKSFASKEEAEQWFPGHGSGVQFIEVGEHLYSLNN